MSAKAVMVLGTTSGAGKSWLATALCRWYARQGLKVAPFKAQNMSNNARVVDGGEIGSAQYFQALAARVVPDVRMNPVLLKPESDTHSQVILVGKVNRPLSHMAWQKRSAMLWPIVKTALDKLLRSNDVVIMEGAGSPAEINLASSDIVNMRVARHARAQCLMIADIDRGGAFAHLYGTWALLKSNDRRLLRGFVLNKFRGDPSLLAPGPDQLQELTGIPTVGVLPMWRNHGLPEEDGVFDDSPKWNGQKSRTMAILAYPHISNLDEFQPLKNVPGINVQWTRKPADLQEAEWIVLPGSKHTNQDLKWMQQQGLDQAMMKHALEGKPVLGICGGLQMLGHTIRAAHGVESSGVGLKLLPLKTELQRTKTVRRRRETFSALSGPWKCFSHLRIQGYEIHHGHTTRIGSNGIYAVMPHNLAWQNKKGNILGLYLHGLFEDPSVIRALFGVSLPHFDTVLDAMADFADRHFQKGFLESLIR